MGRFFKPELDLVRLSQSNCFYFLSHDHSRNCGQASLQAIETGIEGGWAFNPYRAESTDIKKLTFFIVHRFTSIISFCTVVQQ